MVGPAHGSRITREACPPKTGRHPFVSDSTWSTSRASCFGGSALFLAAAVRVALNWCLNRTAATPPQDRVQIFQGPEERALDWILASAHWSQTTGTHLDWDGSHRDSTATATTTQPHCSRGQQNRDSDGGPFPNAGKRWLQRRRVRSLPLLPSEYSVTGSQQVLAS